MLNQIHQLSDEGHDFAFETTLASRSFAVWMSTLKKRGYKLHLIFLWIKSSDLAVQRVQERVKLGGHYISEEVIRRRYHAGLKHFFTLYAPLVDSWLLYDNSTHNTLSMIASAVNNQIVINDPMIWQQLKEDNDGPEKTDKLSEQIREVFEHPDRTREILQAGIRSALMEHKMAGNPIYVSEGNKIIQLEPKDIPDYPMIRYPRKFKEK